MSEAQLGELLLLLALLFAASYGLAGLLARLRIPGILAALLVAMAAHYTPLDQWLAQPHIHEAFDFLAQLGVLFLLFFIGLQIDVAEMRRLSADIGLATLFNTLVPFVLGTLAMLALGYGGMLAWVVGLTRMPTAEAVIVPILDEFQLIRTRVGRFVVGAGVLDDVIEVFMVALVSVWIGERSGALGQVGREVEDIALAAAVFLFLAWAAHRWLLLPLSHWLRTAPRNLILLSMLVLFAAGGFTQFSELGVVVGAIIAGVLLRPVFNAAGAAGEAATTTLRAMTYGFFAQVFFFWVGMSVDLGGVLTSPWPALLLFLATFLGKPLGVLALVPLGRLRVREALAVGVGLNAQLTTEIIVAKLLLDAGLIDVDLFTALVTASSLSTVAVPLLFTLLARAWGAELRAGNGGGTPT